MSSSPRPKSHYRQRPLERKEPPEEDAEVGAENEVRLQVYILVYELLHISRCILHSASPPSEIDEVPPTPTQCAEGLRQTGSLPPGAEAALDESTGTVLETAVEGSPAPDHRPVVDAEMPHMHIRTFRLHVLKVCATMARHARYVTFYIALSALQAWKRFWEHLQQLRWQIVPDS